MIVPGGYVEHGETPQHALVREYMEETGITIEPENIIGIRFNMHDWYIAFRAKYISGEPISAPHIRFRKKEICLLLFIYYCIIQLY